jgi:hypothetical protein
MYMIQKHASRWMSVMIVALAVYAGTQMATATTSKGHLANTSAGYCEARYADGTLLNYTNYGCCITGGDDARLIGCSTSYTKCATELVNGVNWPICTN